GTRSEFIDFVEGLNCNDCFLGFTYSFDHTTINFLNLKLTGSSCQVISTVFRKHSTGNSLLRADSCHLRHVFKAVPIFLNGDDKLRRVMENGFRFVTRHVKTLGKILSPTCTSRNLKCRMREHINNIVSRSTGTTVSRNFLECSDRDINSLKIQGIKMIYQSSRGGDKMSRLLHREAYWIFTLDTRQPKGLNLQFDVACCI
ncbi:hypothetical protein XELAEV_18017148mg, partial [Xenopus laevis]